jgi:hypothetical protein
VGFDLKSVCPPAFAAIDQQGEDQQGEDKAQRSAAPITALSGRAQDPGPGIAGCVGSAVTPLTITGPVRREREHEVRSR